VSGDPDDLPVLVQNHRLPAIFAAAEVSLTATASATTAGAFTPLWRASFVHNQSASHKRTPITSLHRLSRYRIIVKFDKPKPSCFSAETIPKDVHTVWVETRFLKESLYIRFCSLVGQIPHEKLCHLKLS
jgi:hypothetical protein